MTERLYYQNSFLHDFTASLLTVRELADGRHALVLDRTAFYPTSGGQPFDTGWIDFIADEQSSQSSPGLPKLRVSEVMEDEASGDILHIIDGQSFTPELPSRVRGFIDVERRQDHMQQHSGQHVLSAVFLTNFDAPTVSFHMGAETSTIDLDIPNLTQSQLEQAEQRANQLVWEDRQVLMHEATHEQARQVGVRKLPDANHSTLRLIEVRGVDLCACGGTHVKTTGQIGNIQLRKVEKVKQGTRVEFVCGARALRIARKDYQTLTETGALYSSHIYEAPGQTRKLLDAVKAGQKQQQALLAEIAELMALNQLAKTTADSGKKIVSQFLAERDLAFAKLYAQKLVAAEPNVIALIGAGIGSPALVFAQSVGAGFDAGAQLKTLLTSVGGRGGGTKELAQGGVPSAEMIPDLIARARQMAESSASTQSVPQV